MRNEVGHRQRFQRGAQADTERQAKNSAHHGQHCRLGKELPKDIALGRAHRFASANLSRAFCDRYQHDVHHADAAQAQRHDGHTAEKESHDAEDLVQHLGAFHRVPDKKRVFVAAVKVVNSRQRVTHLQNGGFMLLGIGYLKDDVVQVAPCNPGSRFGGRWKISRDRGIRREQIVIVGPVVIGILFFLLQNSDYEVGNTLYQHTGANRRLPGKQLTIGFRPQQQHAPALTLIVLGNQSAFGNLQRAEILVGGPHSNYATTSQIVLADFGNRPPQFRADVLYQVALIVNQVSVVDAQVNLPAGCPTANLRTGTPAPHDDEILPESLHVLFLIDAEAASQTHQDDHRRDSPYDSKHGEEGPHLVGPECSERLTQNFGESHESCELRVASPEMQEQLDIVVLLFLQRVDQAA